MNEEMKMELQALIAQADGLYDGLGYLAGCASDNLKEYKEELKSSGRDETLEDIAMIKKMEKTVRHLETICQCAYEIESSDEQIDDINAEYEETLKSSEEEAA
nr:hypothetical protein [uncultured Cohaesibacter sp.]